MPEKMKTAAFGLAFVAMGLFIAVMMLTHPEGANAPGWVVFAAAGTFVCAGLSVVAQALGWMVFGRALGLVVVYLLALPPLWILFAGEDQSCSAGFGFAGGALQWASAWGCRGVFGFGGLLTLAMAVGFTWASLRRHKKPAPHQPETSNPGE